MVCDGYSDLLIMKIVEQCCILDLLIYYSCCVIVFLNTISCNADRPAMDDIRSHTSLIGQNWQKK
jgi:hypothetical protein